MLSAAFILIIILVSLKKRIGPQYDHIVEFNILCFLLLSSPGTGNIAAAYTLRFAAANLVVKRTAFCGPLFKLDLVFPSPIFTTRS